MNSAAIDSIVSNMKDPEQGIKDILLTCEYRLNKVTNDLKDLKTFRSEHTDLPPILSSILAREIDSLEHSVQSLELSTMIIRGKLIEYMGGTN